MTHPDRSRQRHTASDRALIGIEQALRSISGASRPSRAIPRPQAEPAGTELPATEKRLSGALMRVNHVGEICAQALYHAQAMTTRSPELRAHFEQAASDEADHLAWTRQRLVELDSRVSLLAPVWYLGAYGIGLAAGLAGDRASLGFVVETEKQVEEHLAGHLDRLPAEDLDSRAIVTQMKIDEAMHAAQAQEAGATELPAAVKQLMRWAAKVMTRTAHYI
jgi:ubiquinone biosynthesis monooxygenase Coq7